MFQDLVEAEILYGAIFNNDKTIRFRPGLFDGLWDLFPDICPEYPQLQNMIRVR